MIPCVSANVLTLAWLLYVVCLTLAFPFQCSPTFLPIHLVWMCLLMFASLSSSLLLLPAGSTSYLGHHSSAHLSARDARQLLVEIAPGSSPTALKEDESVIRFTTRYFAAHCLHILQSNYLSPLRFCLAGCRAGHFFLFVESAFLLQWYFLLCLLLAMIG